MVGAVDDDADEKENEETTRAAFQRYTLSANGGHNRLNSHIGSTHNSDGETVDAREMKSLMETGETR